MVRADQREWANIVVAFDILVDEIQKEIDKTNRLGAGAFENGEYEKAGLILARAARMAEYREKVKALRQEWMEIAPIARDPEAVPGAKTRVSRSNFGRLQRGQRTPEEAFVIPILKSLHRRGGSAKVGDVLQDVYESMANVLREVDHEPVPSDPNNPRWRNTAQWARNKMVQQGLLMRNSPRGVWTISNSGMRFLEEHMSNQTSPK